jgi:hypothetical protein
MIAVPHRILIAAALAAILPAQDVAPNRFVPADSVAVMRFGAPARWQSSFAKTHVSKLMQSETLSPLMAQAGMVYQMMLGQARESGAFDADLIERFVAEYKGDFVVSVQVDFDGLRDAITTGQPPAFSGVIALTPDGSFDLAPLAANLERLIEQNAPNAGNLRDLVVGDLRLRHASDEDMGATVPAMVDGHLVMLFGNDLEKTAAELLSKDRRHSTADTSPLFVHFALDRAMTTIREVLGEEMDDGTGMADAMLEAVGVFALQSMTMNVKPDGAHVVSEISIGAKAEGRGMLGALGTTTKAPRLLGAVPSQCESFSVTSMNVGPIYDTIAKVWSGLEDFVPMSFEDAMAAFADATKVRLKEDLIDHIGGELLMVQDLDAVMEAAANMDDEEDPMSALSGAVYGLALQNGKAFGESVEKALRSRGMHAGRKTQEYAGQQVHRLRIAGLVEVEYVITDDLFLLGVGSSEGTQRALRDVLDTRARGENTLPAVAKAHVDAMPGGWNSLSVSPMAATLQGIATGIAAAGDLDEEAAMVAQVCRGLGSDMKRLGIGTMVGATYPTTSGWLSRIRW